MRNLWTVILFCFATSVFALCASDKPSIKVPDAKADFVEVKDTAPKIEATASDVTPLIVKAKDEVQIHFNQQEIKWLKEQYKKELVRNVTAIVLPYQQNPQNGQVTLVMPKNNDVADLVLQSVFKDQDDMTDQILVGVYNIQPTEARKVHGMQIKYQEEWDWIGKKIMDKIELSPTFYSNLIEAYTKVKKN